MNTFIKILIFSLLFYSSHAFSQNPFKIIEHAEKNYKNGRFKASLRKLNRAEKPGYCSCGDCSFQVNMLTNLLRYKIYLKQKKYELSRQALDSIYTHYTEFNIDSLKVISYKNELGEDLLLNSIDDALLNSYIIEFRSEGNSYFVIPLTVPNISLKFKLDIYTTYEIYKIESDTRKNEIVREKFIKSPAYQLIKTSAKKR